MIIYLAGKITGDNNYKAKFKRYELKYRLQGYTVLNPAIGSSPCEDIPIWRKFK